jgi:hypothetical protein
MKIKNIYEISTLSRYYNEYNVSKEELAKNNHNQFRYICFRYIEFIRKIDIPKIKKNLDYEAVLIEYRKFPHLEFLIRNTILKLGPTWSYTIVCGSENYEYMLDMCSKISLNIKVIETMYENLNQSEYSKFLSSLEFWDLIFGKKVLIYQEDSIIFKNNIEKFLEYDFIGAPFPKNQNDTPNCVGNGGFSIRSTNIMKKVIQMQSIESTKFNTSTLAYMKNVGLTYPPEDIYFSKVMQELSIGVVADWEVAYNFSTESVSNMESFGGHKFWISNPNWKKMMSEAFDYGLYSPANDIQLYLAFKNLTKDYDKTPTIKNAFDVDIRFCNTVNNLNMKSETEILTYIKNVALNGYIYHPKQLTNIFPNIKFYKFMNKLFVENNLLIYKPHDFVEKYLYKKSFDSIAKKLIRCIYDRLNKSVDLLLLVFIGNEPIGRVLIEKIIAYRKIQDFNIAFCFNSEDVNSALKPIIKENFSNYTVYMSNEMGTDITPTMLMYDSISKKYSFNHIIKFHTKSISNIFNELTDFLLSMPLEKLIKHKHHSCNCIGYKKHYIDLKDDPWIKISLIKHSSKLDIDKKFVGGTIFYAEKGVFDATLKFMKENSSNAYLLNNLYENNTINRDFSPIHFLERLFGVINI